MKRFFRTVAGCAVLVGISMQAHSDNYPWQKPEPTKADRPTANVPRPDQPLSQVPDCDGILSDPRYRLLAREMSELHLDRNIRAAAQRFGMVVTNTSWQDSRRGHNTSGNVATDNMSDVTLVSIAKQPLGEVETYAQPIFRLNNFNDVTVDVDMDQIFVPVGNAWGVKPFAVGLRDLLEGMSEFLSWREPIKGSLYEPSRDSQVLVSAQGVILPVPEGGEAHFVSSIFNHQSTVQYPAVLVIMISNRGTSITVVDNSRDIVRSRGMGRGQMLFHNVNGEKAPFTIQDIDHVRTTQEGRDRIKELEQSGQKVAGQSGVNQVTMIQVPLKYPARARRYGGVDMLSFEAVTTRSMDEPRMAGGVTSLNVGVVDVAKYTLGRFIELNGKGPGLERDTTGPIRVDVVKYFTSPTTQISEEQLRMIPDSLAQIYQAGKNLGSLVTGDDYTRITRNYQPWRNPWWEHVVHPYLSLEWRPKPWLYFEQKYGANWIYRFANEEMAARTMREMADQK